MVKRKSNLYSRPKKAFDSARIAEEGIIVKKYGLKNKKEIWKAKSKVSEIRRRAKSLIPQTDEKKKEFFEKLQKIGLNVNNIVDALALTTENLLDRRLQTVLFSKGLSSTILQSRQLIVHKNVLVAGNVVNIPSFIVTRELENKISLKVKSRSIKKEEVQ
jgi:small subunit ribosomal protein S4